MKDKSLPEHHQSIFHQLFEHASDQDCQLILLDQILEIGDEREFPLLDKLKNSDYPIVCKKATRIRHQLHLKLYGPSKPGERKRLPMSLCFLYDEFNIRPANFKPDSAIDFEISPDIYEMD
ncbi:hypothetical protein [Flagellimonas onchidii]|uniref:hypothetical protein n=1 Tax=Flagellimonas onchidii TaxID=2562684 RepID=UPI0010A65564|nr:hypothetical protein [Allomuricauda onchidii]